MLKRPVIPIASTPKSKILSFKCGDCLHFKRVSKFEKVCSQLGVKRFAEAPSCFTVDPFVLTVKSPDRLNIIGMLFHDMTPQERRVLVMMLRQSAASKKNYSLEFGQPVYFWIKRDYLSNYYKGFVLGTSNFSGAQVFITSDLNGTQRKTLLTATLFRENVFSIVQFAKKKKELIKQGKVNDPTPMIERPKVNVDYVPPTLDEAPAEWLDKTTKKAADKKPTRRQELTGKLSFDVQRRRAA